MADRPQVDERGMKAFDFASEMTKQLLTLSTAILTITVALAEKVLDVTAEEDPVWLLVGAWVLYVVSIVCGLLTFGTMVGSLASKPDAKGSPSVYDSNIRTPSLAQSVAFGCATFAILAFGIWALLTPNAADPEAQGYWSILHLF